MSEEDDDCPNCGEARATKLRTELKVFEGKWVLDEKIGEGGMGTVYLATDLALDRKVAIKTLSRSVCSDASMVARFEREAKMMAKLDHPNLVPIHAVGRHEDVPFIVMKLLEGSNLSQYMRAHARLPISEILQIMKQICAGLAFVHSRGVIHRDIKPANIFVSPEGHVTLLDLGVAHDPKSSMTKSGMMVGTPRYMAPEQVMGQKVDHRSDLYALGVLLFELLAGKPPFDAESDFSIMKAHTDADVPDPTEDTDLPRAINAVTQRALAKKADDRFQSAGELMAALETAAKSGSGNERGAEPKSRVRPRATPAPVRNSPPPRDVTTVQPSIEDDAPLVVPKSKGPIIGAAIAVVLLVGAGLALGFSGGEKEAPPAHVPSYEEIELPENRPPVVVAPVVAEVKPVEEKPVVAEVKPVAEPKPPKPDRPKQPKVAAAATGPAEMLVTVTVGGAPSWAWLDVNGMRQGATPKKVKLDAARHKIHLERPGFKPIDLEVTLAPGETKKLPLKLEPQ